MRRRSAALLLQEAAVQRLHFEGPVTVRCMTLEHHDHVRRTDDVAMGLHHRLAGLRATLRDRRVLLVGRMASSVAMRRLLRYTGARFMAAADPTTALHLARRFAIEIVVADADEDDEDLAPFEREGVVVVRLARADAMPAELRSAA